MGGPGSGRHKGGGRSLGMGHVGNTDRHMESQYKKVINKRVKGNQSMDMLTSSFGGRAIGTKKHPYGSPVGRTKRK